MEVAVTDLHVLQLLRAVTCSVCGASCGASCMFLHKEELKDDAKKLAEKAKTALHG